MATRNPEDTFDHYRQEMDSPARYAFTITPGDDDLPASTRGIYIGSGGNLYVRMTGRPDNVADAHANVTFVGAVTGTILPVRVDKVWAHANTTATELVGLY